MSVGPGIRPHSVPHLYCPTNAEEHRARTPSSRAPAEGPAQPANPHHAERRRLRVDPSAPSPRSTVLLQTVAPLAGSAQHSRRPPGRFGGAAAGAFAARHRPEGNRRASITIGDVRSPRGLDAIIMLAAERASHSVHRDLPANGGGCSHAPSRWASLALSHGPRSAESGNADVGQPRLRQPHLGAHVQAAEPVPPSEQMTAHHLPRDVM